MTAKQTLEKRALKNGTSMPESTVSPVECLSMEEVRAGIDQVDRDLVALMTTRQAYIEAAARIKPDFNTVRVPWRIEDVVTKVLAEASKSGLSARIAEPVWRVLIEQSIRHEGEIWQMLRRNTDNNSPDKSVS